MIIADFAQLWIACSDWIEMKSISSTTKWEEKPKQSLEELAAPIVIATNRFLIDSRQTFQMNCFANRQIDFVCRSDVRFSSFSTIFGRLITTLIVSKLDQRSLMVKITMNHSSPEQHIFFSFISFVFFSTNYWPLFNAAQLIFDRTFRARLCTIVCVRFFRRNSIICDSFAVVVVVTIWITVDPISIGFSHWEASEKDELKIVWLGVEFFLALFQPNLTVFELKISFVRNNRQWVGTSRVVFAHWRSKVNFCRAIN